MNERIRELYIQTANETADGKEWAIGGLHNAEKFAELVVRECLNQVREQYQPVLEDELMMKDTHWDGYVQCGVDSYVAIREHFYGEEE